MSETSTLVLGPLSELGVPPGSVISGQSLDFTFPHLPTELDFLGVLPEPLDDLCTYLHLVDVGGVDPLATVRHHGFAAAVGHPATLGFLGQDVCAVLPIG